MPSELKSETARINGAQSHGPATAEGKAVSAQNSLRHGLCSKQVVLPGEDPQAFEDLCASYLQSFRPHGPAEKELVETIAGASWRLKRIMRVETALLSDDTADVLKVLGLLLRYENQLNRTYDLSIKRLEALKENRPTAKSSAVRNEPKPAAAGGPDQGMDRFMDQLESALKLPTASSRSLTAPQSPSADDSEAAA
jgi:hypothetical protein